MRKKILSIILTTTMVLGLTPCIPCVKQVKQVAVMVVAGETMNFSIIQTVQKIHMYQMEH